MLSDVFWIVFIVALIINYVGAVLMGKAAEEKGYPDIHAVAWCFWFGIFGYFYILSLPDKKLQNKMDTIIDLLEKQNNKLAQPSQAQTYEEFRLPEL